MNITQHELFNAEYDRKNPLIKYFYLNKTLLSGNTYTQTTHLF